MKQLRIAASIALLPLIGASPAAPGTPSEAAECRLSYADAKKAADALNITRSRGEDPKAARIAALNELGYIGDVRDSMRRVWYSRLYDTIEALSLDLRVSLRSLLNAKGFAATVILTLGLGIGANAAIFTLVRGVLLKPLVNRDEDRLIYVRQTAPGLGIQNYTFSMPEVRDITSRVKTVAAFGDFSTADLALVRSGGASCDCRR